MKEEDKRDTNKRIKKIREISGLTRDEFATKVGIKSSQLANIEHEKQFAPSWMIQSISKEYKEYGYWLGTGETIESAGQISPDIEESRRNLKTGTH
ncbi:MAG: helix-turn-helix domain-containing protein [Methylomarinum sp.]|nr:helix-turn-helix domain-containing protein [Methylomarinum sp.]